MSGHPEECGPEYESQFYGHPGPPQALDAERAILGMMLLDRDAAPLAGETLHAEDFYREGHRIIYAAMQHLCAVDEGWDEIQLREHLADNGDLDRIGGREHIRDLVQGVTSMASIRAHISAVKASSQTRDVISACKDAIVAAHAREPISSVVDSLENQLLAMSTHGPSGSVSLASILPGVLEELKSGRRADAVKTGYEELDNLTGGFHGGDLVILAARASMGKTSLALNFADQIAGDGMGVLKFSLEMTKEQIARNMICLRAGVDSGEMGRGRLFDSDWKYIDEVKDGLCNMPLEIIDSADISTGRVRSAVRRMARKGVGLVIIDYLQLMKGEDPRDELRTAMVKVTRGLKALAKSCNIPVLALSQLTRGAEEREPRLSDLKESGSIEEDADIVLLLSREDRGSSKAKVEVAKNRGGPVGFVELEFTGKYFLFTDGER